MARYKFKVGDIVRIKRVPKDCEERIDRYFDQFDGRTGFVDDMLEIYEYNLPMEVLKVSIQDPAAGITYRCVPIQPYLDDAKHFEEIDEDDLIYWYNELWLEPFKKQKDTHGYTEKAKGRR